MLVPSRPYFPWNGLSGFRGYSLIELLAVLVIVSLLTAIALPTVKNVIVDRKTSVAALEVKAFLEAARARAIARGRPVSVILERLSSRSEDGVTSSTANNSPAAPQDNFDVYNTCIRMTMAESLRSMEFEISPTVVPEDTATGSSQLGNDNDGILESCRLYDIDTGGSLVLQNALVTNRDIELIDQNSQSHTFRITNVWSPGGNVRRIAIQNDGDTSNPFGSNLDIKNAADNQIALKAYQTLPTTFSFFRIQGLPNPVTSTINELPRGSCVDLSLSGLATDDPNVNTTANVYRDCQREFASDWILPPGGTPVVPTPQDLRPVYLTFSPNGTLQSILCNAPGANTLRRIEPHSDVFLFVGRVDQVVRASSLADLASALDQNLNTNLTDATAYWVRISPASGTIAAAPAQASHILEDMEIYRTTSADEPIGHLLHDSRSLAFTSEATSQ